MGKIKELISMLKESGTIEKEYILEEMYDMCCKDIDDIQKELKEHLPGNNTMYATLFLSTEEKLKEIQTRLFKMCCDVKGIKESQSAFCLYRDFLTKYNDVMHTYNFSIKEVFGDDINKLTVEILDAKEKLLPINNDNIHLHVEHHKSNEPIMESIEDLENKRRELLKNMA